MRQFWNITSGIYVNYHVQIMLLFVYTTTLKRCVIFTCWYLKLSWNTTALNQSNCRNFSCSSIVILTWLRGFLVMFLHLVWFSLCSNLFWELRDNRVLKKGNFDPKASDVMIEFWYIERGPFTYITHETYLFNTSCYFVIYQQFLRYHLPKKSKI